MARTLRKYGEASNHIEKDVDHGRNSSYTKHPDAHWCAYNRKDLVLHFAAQTNLLRGMKLMEEMRALLRYAPIGKVALLCQQYQFYSP